MTQSSSSSDAFNDSLNFVKKLWGQMGVPGMTMPAMPGVTIPGMPTMPLPTMSLEELDKRIQELKTVETWLNVNLSMLRNTIQALEVQRATIATLHSLSSTMSKSMQDFGATAGQAPVEPQSEEKPAEPDATSEQVSPLIAQSAAWWQGVQDQFKQALGTALEKSAASFEAAAPTAQKAPAKTSAAAGRSRSGTKSTRKAPAARSASKPKTAAKK